METGIYSITNKINGKRYIGKAINIKARWGDHKRYLNRDTHHNLHLLKAWKKYGEENFLFEIIELCKKEELIDREIFYISFFDSTKNGYNMTLGGDGILGHKHTPDTKRIISEKAIGRKITKEQIQKRKETINNWSDEEKKVAHKNMSNGHKGRVVSAETRQHLSDLYKGKPSKRQDYRPSEETRNKISKSLKGKVNTEESIIKMKNTIKNRTAERKEELHIILSESSKKRGISPENREKMNNARWRKENTQ